MTTASSPRQPGRLFCSRPFRCLHVSGFRQPKGDAYLCCPSWLSTVVGNVQLQGIEDVWNGDRAQQVRRSILDGSFDHCSGERCPFLQTISGPVSRIEDVTDPELREVIDQQLTVLPFGPREVNCSYDRSCNLSCPTCRTEHIIETAQEVQILTIQEKLDAAMGDTELLYITGSGDAFGSPYFNRWIRGMKLDDKPNLERIHLHTNAQLWTEKMWSKIPAEVRLLIKEAEISIDAASAEVYHINRRGGDFQQLLANLDFIRELRISGPLQYLKLSMVVQLNNFREMPAFVELAKRFAADEAYFGQLVNWGSFSESEFEERAVHLPQHPLHREFLSVLSHDSLHARPAFLGNLADLLRDPAILQPSS